MDTENAQAVFTEACDLILAPGATEVDQEHAFKLVDNLADAQLSVLIRRTASDWLGPNPLQDLGDGVESDPADTVAYDYEDEDAED